MTDATLYTKATEQLQKVAYREQAAEPCARSRRAEEGKHARTYTYATFAVLCCVVLCHSGGGGLQSPFITHEIFLTKSTRA
jgi:hypothetical protein